MKTATVSQREYKNLIKRQERIEEELNILKALFRAETEEAQVKPAVLKRWERISRELDRGRGRAFYSSREMKQWLGRL